MRWSRTRDYHGSRLYEEDRPAVRQSSFWITWLVEMVKQKLRSLTARPAPPIVLLQGRERNFSLLGESSRRSTYVNPRDGLLPIALASRVRHED